MRIAKQIRVGGAASALLTILAAQVGQTMTMHTQSQKLRTACTPPTPPGAK
jgi:hypothetical protein